MEKDGKAILVVEDDEAAAELMEIVLASLDHQVTVVPSVEDGLEGFPKDGYDLVITDLNMRGLGGLKGISEFRERAPGMPVIVVSASYRSMTPEDSAKVAAGIGATAVLGKPFEIHDLTRLVGEVLGESPD